MGKFIVGVMRIVPLCAVVLVLLPAVVDAQCPSQLSVQRVWTQDAGGTEKTAFTPGEPLQFVAEVNTQK